MRLFEYQAKELFAAAGIPVLKSAIIENMTELGEAIQAVGLPCVLKAQVLSGGRGKAGLVRLAKTVDEAEEITKALFHHTVQVPSILVEQAADIDREIYLAVTMDPTSGNALIMGCAEGGVEIETLAKEAPERIEREWVGIARGLQPYQINDFVFRLGMRGDTFKKVCKVVGALYSVFDRYDAELAEINPLFLTRDGAVVAGDGKLSIDDNSMFRHADYDRGRAYYHSDMEYEAAKEGIPYIEFNGDISLMCAGAGLANTVYDLIQYEGGRVANYLEFGGPNYMKAGTAMRLCLANKPKVILIVTFGTIARADVMAEGIVKAIRELAPNCPIVACLRGTGEERVEEIFAPVGLKQFFDTEEAVRSAIEIAAGRWEQ